jgi:hypothetical protein
MLFLLYFARSNEVKLEMLGSIAFRKAMGTI